MENIKTLLEDDKAIIALHLRMELELSNYVVCGFVGSGEEAIQKAKTENPDLILMDINLS